MVKIEEKPIHPPSRLRHRVIKILSILELCIFYRITQVHTSKQGQKIRNSTPINVNETKQGYKATVLDTRIA